MKTNAFLLILILALWSFDSFSQDAPVTTAGIVNDATTAPESVVVPITVENFVSIGSFTLTLRYQADRVTYESAETHPSLTGMTVTNTANSTFGKLVISWPETAGGITLPDKTSLAELTFTYISSSSVLNWLDAGSYVCEYKKYSGGSFILLNDSPRVDFYKDGVISNRPAPVTYAPDIIGPAPGNLAVPITVDDFTDIGAMTLTLEYNQDILTYQGCTPNAGLGGFFNSGTQTGTNGRMQVVITWFGLASLADGSTVATINFDYSTTTGSSTSLNWIDNGSSCEYTDPVGNTLPDLPTGDYYKNGSVYTQYSPKVWLPVIKDAISSESITLPVFTNDFTDVSSFTLSFEYDDAVMSYTGFTPDAAFGSDLTVTDNPSGSGRKIEMSWTGTGPLTLPEGSTIASLDFNYISGTTSLNWITDDGTSCRFNDSNGNAYFDEPKEEYYEDGLITSQAAPQVAALNLTATAGQQVTVPVITYNYSDIGYFYLTLDYDPSILTYQSSSVEPTLGGTFNATTEGLGRLILEWSGTTGSLPDSSNLMDLVFTYSGEESALAWFDDGASCRFAGTSTDPDLYDQPQLFYYVNGYVGPDPLSADFIATPVSLRADFDTTILLTDQTTGSPTTWNWTISPSTYYFVNGTSASSQNPVVKFTSNGVYTVTLIVTRGNSAGIKVRTDYMYIGIPGLWTGLTSGVWNTGSNWHNFQVPDVSLDVTIPDDALNWPHITGDLTIGSLCENITLEGASELYIDGNLTIDPGSAMTFTGNGKIVLGGDWDNSGTFNYGTGTVEFGGTENATLKSQGVPQDFYKISVTKGPGRLFIEGTVNVLGTDE